MGTSGSAERGAREPPAVTAVPTAFARELSAAVDASGISLHALQRRLQDHGVRISLAALSYWRSGQRQPEGPGSLDAVDELERILGLIPGHLTGRLGPSRRPGVVRERAAYGDLLELPLAVALTGHLDRLGLLGVADDLAEVTVIATVDVDRRGQVRSQSTRTLYRAVRGGVRSIPLVVTNGGSPLLAPPVLRSVHGGVARRRVVDRSAGVCVWELGLDAPLTAGATTVVESVLDVPVLDEPALGPQWEHHLLRPARELLLWVRFDPSRRPASCVAWERTPGEAERTRQLEVDAGGSTHLSMHGSGPGTLGIRWLF